MGLLIPKLFNIRQIKKGKKEIQPTKRSQETKERERMKYARQGKRRNEKKIEKEETETGREIKEDIREK